MKTCLVLLFVSAFVFAGCNRSVAPPDSNSAAVPQNLSPAETMKTLNDAAKAKDTAKTKALISKGTIALLEDSAKTQNKTVDELLLEEGGAPFQELPEIRNEKITGDTATVEVKNSVTGEWQPLPFVKEDGVWKIALDKVVSDVLEQARKAMQNSNSGVVNSNKK